ncbi:hypothetical protein GGI12_003837 [Dipsacomyces acuminosporus]|nr:hypothetical protein GGI12_003837 [Dipsacomyces acuminosporus]
MPRIGEAETDAGVAKPSHAWLERAPSSDVAFSNMVFETSAQLSANSLAKNHGAADAGGPDIVPIANAKVEPQNEQTPKVLCLQCLSPIRKITAAPERMPSAEYESRTKYRWLAEHVTGSVSMVADQDGSVLGLSASFSGDLKCAWFVDHRTVGAVRTNANSEHKLQLSVSLTDLLTNTQVTSEMESIPSGNGQISVIAQGHYVVAYSGGDPGLKYWHIEHKPDDASSGLGILLKAGSFDSTKECVVDMRWVDVNIGIAFTRSSAFWFNVLTGQATPLSRKLQSLPDTLSWRWQESVIAVTPARNGAGKASMPTCPVLCLPSPAGMSFHLLETPQTELKSRPFDKGWVWLCGSVDAYVVLSPCRRKATVCKMPSGEPAYTVELQGKSKI